MAAIPSDIAFHARSRISAPALRRALVAGMRRVISRREFLNKINVFPVPDGDTGSNLAFTLNSVLGRSLSRRSRSVGELLRAVADDAIDGARGNSGAIIAQFLYGASEAVGETNHLSLDRLAYAAQAGSRHARSALAQPKEGTILSVIRAFSDGLQLPADNLNAWFSHAVNQARMALAETPKQLAVLRQAGVVDAGAQGFVDLVEGIEEYIQHRQILMLDSNSSEDSTENPLAHWHDEADASCPWCTECLIEAAHIDHGALRAALMQLGADSVVVAGGAARVRVHAHVADPAMLFDVVGRFGYVSGRKADNMLAQHRAAQRQSVVTIITDSGADIPRPLRDALPLDVVPVRVNFGDEDFLDGVSLSNAEFYRRLRESDVLPKTSQPPIGDFKRQFELSLAHSESVIYVGLSRALSGTLQAGEGAAAQIGSACIDIVDSGSASCGQALLAIAAAECAEAGGDVASIKAHVLAMKAKTFTFAAIRDIGHAVRGGRIPKWVAPIANGLGLTPLAKIKDGRLKVCGALFGAKNVPVRLARYVAAQVPKGYQWRLVVGHCDAKASAETLLQALQDRLAITQHWITETGPAIGAHAGPGALVVSLQVVGSVESEGDRP